MDACFFRHLARELSRELDGSRLGKIFEPAPRVWTMEIQRPGPKTHLLFRPARQAGLLFLSPAKPPNPHAPTPKAMWLRKRLSGRRVEAVSANWPDLVLRILLSPRREPPDRGIALVLDLRSNLRVEQAQVFDPSWPEPEWPAAGRVRTDSEVWKDHPHISPPLRRLAKSLAPEEFDAVYARLMAGEAESFALCRAGDRILPPRAWADPGPGGNPEGRIFDSALEASRAWGEPMLFPELEKQADTRDRTAFKRALKRARRNLAKVEEEEARMRAMVRMGEWGRALQAGLYRFQDGDTPKSVLLDTGQGEPVRVELDTRLTPAENMERFFRLAAKGGRGLKHAARRRRELAREVKRLEQGGLPETSDDRAPGGQGPEKEPSGRMALPKRFRGIAAAAFVSSDGFLLVRGKNAKANRDLATSASPFDYWLHVAGGPGAHVIVKRDHPSQEVPETTLEQAGVLAALKSWRAEDSKAEVHVALVKDVRAVKGFAAGQVAVDQVLMTLVVEPDPAVEAVLVAPLPS